VVMELINKDSRIDGPIKVHDLHRYPLDSKVVQFLLRTESAYSIDELKKVIKSPSFEMYLLKF
jgi:hypothetical protein